MRVLADKLNVVWSSKVMPSAASGPVISASCSKIGSLMRSAATFPGLPRVTVALPCSVATWPTSPVASSAAGAAGFCAGAGGFCARAAKRPKHRSGRCADRSQLLDEVAPFQIGL
jgi:hypothetical protein